MCSRRFSRAAPGKLGAALIIGVLALSLAPQLAAARQKCFGQKATITLRPVKDAKNPVAPTEIGTPGNDVIVSHAPSLLISGGPGKDRICGTASTVNGNAGNDRIELKGESMAVSGGPGNDFLEITGPDSSTNGNGGTDLLRLKGSRKLGDGGPGDDRIEDLGGTGDGLRGGSGNDSITVTHSGQPEDPADDDVLSGGPGDDILQGGFGGARILGGAGDDSLQGGDGDDELNGGPDTDSCNGGRGLDIAADCETVAGFP